MLKIDKKGFTLYELLGVIIVLALICLVAFPPILNTIKKNKDDIDEISKDLVFSASKLYVNNHMSMFKLDTQPYYACISVKTLIDEGLLIDGALDEQSNINSNSSVKVVKENSKYVYTIAKSGECINE